MVCCTIGLVARHHGESIADSYQKSSMHSVSKFGKTRNQRPKIKKNKVSRRSHNFFV